jgi:uncharacterized protein (TIGR02145 family)
MKALINSLKRTNWLKASVLCLTCLLFLTFPSCQKDELNQDSILGMESMSSSVKSQKPHFKGTVKDKDENVYNIVKIGKQYWMAENLKTTKYRNGDLIGTTTPATKDISTETYPKYQWAYEGNESNVAAYGRLYTWYAVTDSRNLCPTGWHVPTIEEFTTLIDYLGGESVAGDKLKETGTTHWQNPNTEATNESGFTALPGGYRDLSGTFGDMGYGGLWWSSTEDSEGNAWHLYMNIYVSVVYRNVGWERKGYSVRCLMN